MWARVHPSHLRLCWWVKGLGFVLCTYFLGTSPEEDVLFCYLFINGMNVTIYSYLLSLARCQKPPYKICKVLQDSKPHNHCLSKKRPDAELFFAHIFRTHLVLERSRLHLVPTFVVGIFPFQDFTALGTRATFVADPSSLCKIKLCSHSPKKKKSPKAM